MERALHSGVRECKLQLEGLCSETEGHKEVQDNQNCRSTYLCPERSKSEALIVDLYPHCQKVVHNIEGSAQLEGQDNYGDD